MLNKNTKILPILLIYFSTFANLISAEGIIDFNPHITTSLNVDNNVFRFDSKSQALATFGSSETGDLLKRIDVGADVNLRLSRQLFSLSANINRTQYNRFDFLNNDGKFYSLIWNWQLGNDVFGVISTSHTQAIVGFNEIRSSVKNLRTFDRDSFSINWNLHPDWTIYALVEKAQLENELDSFSAINRNDDVYETGLRYRNLANTQLGFAYRQIDSNFPSRNAFVQSLFGENSVQKEIITNIQWLPTNKIRLSTRLSIINLDYINLPQRAFKGFNQRYNLDYSLTGKTNVNLTAFQEVAPIDDILSTFVKTKGFAINPSWNITSKILLRAGAGYEDREYLGGAAVSPFFNTSLLDNQVRDDESIFTSLALLYTPTDKSVLQLLYQGEKRVSNIINQQYQFQALNLSLRYNF